MVKGDFIQFFKRLFFHRFSLLWVVLPKKHEHLSWKPRIAKLGDFGIARQIPKFEAGKSFHHIPASYGTPRYPLHFVKALASET